MKVQDHAFILHSRPYTDNKILVDFFTPQYGIISAVFRSAKRRPQSFVYVDAQWQGKGELKTLTSLEDVNHSFPLQGQALFCAMYLNELILRLLPKEDPHPELFESYIKALAALAETASETKTHSKEITLRYFELTLIEELGYAINFFSDTQGEKIEREGLYLFNPEKGFERVLGESTSTVYSLEAIKGARLRDIGNKDFSDVASLKAAKIIMRKALAPHLGSRPLKTRELFF